MRRPYFYTAQLLCASGEIEIISSCIMRTSILRMGPKRKGWTMARGVRRDLTERLEECFLQRMCAVTASQSDAHRLREALRAGSVMSPFPQLYTLPNLWSTINRYQQELYIVRSLASKHPDWIFADVSAAIVHGLWVSYPLLNAVHIVTSPHAHSRSSRYVSRHQIACLDTEVVDGVRVTSLERTCFDCLRRLSFRQSLPIADSTLRVSGKDIGHFIEAFDSFHRSAHNHGRASSIMSFANNLSESGGESLARAAMIEQGYMLPTLQVEVPNMVDYGASYYVDFCWYLSSGTIYGEMDGREKYTNPEMTHGRDSVDVLADERLRESRISINGVKILRFGYRDVTRVSRFRYLLDVFGVPSGYAVPDVARTDNPLNKD